MVDHRYVLVTGANSGLGLAVCCRLVDDFLAPNGPRGLLTVIFTTRSTRKASATLAVLEQHLSKHHSTSTKSDRRVYFQSETVDLTRLLTVRALSRKLLESDIPQLDAIILNAGMGGWSGLNWPRVVWTSATNLTQATVWPDFKLCYVGLITDPQLPAASRAREEPVLGQVFCANVFGHYLLAHWLMPLLRSCPRGAPAKVIWVSSVECVKHHYNPDDHQGLKSHAVYEHSKRLTDLMALTARETPATEAHVRRFLTPAAWTRPGKPPISQTDPTIHVVHPGTVATAIVPLPWILEQSNRAAATVARSCGSPWSNVSPYLGANSATWLALAWPADIHGKELEAADQIAGPVKWGSAINRLGQTSVRPTDVEGWGINGAGAPFKDKWWAGRFGRKTGSTDATAQDVADFIAEGAHVWARMEALRDEWERYIDDYEKDQSTGTVS